MSESMSQLSVIKKRYLYPLIVGIRLVIGLVFMQMGAQKIVYEDFYAKGFPIRIADFLSSLQSHEAFWDLLAVGEISIGLLLVTQRFATLGALALFPMIISLYVITSQGPGTFKIVTGGFLLLNILLLAWDYRKLRVLFGGNYTLTDDRSPRRFSDIMIATGITSFVAGFVCKIHHLDDIHVVLTITSYLIFAFIPLRYAYSKFKRWIN